MEMPRKIFILRIARTNLKNKGRKVLRNSTRLWKNALFLMNL